MGCLAPRAEQNESLTTGALVEFAKTKQFVDDLGLLNQLGCTEAGTSEWRKVRNDQASELSQGRDSSKTFALRSSAP
jgi:hypothetical protein